MGRYYYPHFIVDQWTSVPEVEPVDLSGQTVLVVGANVGLGLETAKYLARMSPEKLLVTCRSVKKGEDTIKEIQSATGFDRVYAHTVDLSIFASVISFAEALEKTGERINLLIYNAAVARRDYKVTTDGFEETIQVNDLSCALLCVLLLPRMLDALKVTEDLPYRPRIVIVSSDTHYWVEPTPEETNNPHLLGKLNANTAGGMKGRYPMSKLINVLFTRELAARLPSSRIVVNTVNPGLCHSSLRRNFSTSLSLRSWLYINLLARSTEAGARELLWAAVARRHCEKEIHGKYVSDMQVKEESDFAMSPDGFELQRRLWDETIDILSDISPRFKEIVDSELALPHP